MASITKRGKKYLVRWRDPDGSERGRTCPDYDTAQRLRREVERVVALGNAWSPEDARTAPALIEIDRAGEVIGGALVEFVEQHRGELAPGTHRHYDRALRRFIAWLAQKNPRRRRLTVDLVTTEEVEDWFRALRDEQGLSIATARLYVSAVRRAWKWMRRRKSYRDWTNPLEDLELGPSPVYAHARAPTWDQMDAVIAAAYDFAESARSDRDRSGRIFRARLCTVLRFTGLRVHQALHLRWDDVDFDEQLLHIRPELGKSRRERRGREIPLSPHLLDALAGWGSREGYVLAPWRTCRASTTPVMSKLWQAANVPAAVWAPQDGRKKGNPHHAFRKGFKTGLARLGVPSDVRDYLVGHHRGVDEHYVDAMVQAREAVALIPPLTDEAVGARVIALHDAMP